MTTSDAIRHSRIRLVHGQGAMPAVGFGTLIPDPAQTKQAVKTALEVGFRHFDCAERYRNEEGVGDAMREIFEAGTVQREEVFVTTKLWHPNIARSASGQPVRQVSADFNSTMQMPI